MPHTKERASPDNKLLAALPRREYQRLIPNLEEIPLLFEKVLYEPGDSILDVYFSTSSIVSLLAGVEDRATLEVGLVGREGMVCVPIFMGVNTSLNRAVVQGASPNSYAASPFIGWNGWNQKPAVRTVGGNAFRLL